MTNYQRPISPTERLYLAGARVTPPFAIQIVVEGTGPIDADELAHAVAVASEACPGARLVKRGRQWVDSRQSPAVHVLGDISADVLRIPLDPMNGPTSEVLLVTGEQTTVVFRVSHAAMDGHGVFVWMTDVFRVLRGERPLGARSTMIDWTLVDRMGTPGHRPRMRMGWRAPVNGAPGSEWLRRTIAGHHEGLVAKVASVIAHATGDTLSRVMIPVDLRRHDPHVASTANLTLPVFLDVAVGEPWQEVNARLIEALVQRRELTTGGVERLLGGLPPRATGAIFRAARGLSRITGMYALSAIVSHVGRVDPATFRSATFDATTVYGLPVHDPIAPISLAAVEFQGHTELTLACPEGSGNELLDRIENALSSHEILSPAEPPPVGTTITDLLSQQVKATPDSVAVIGSSLQLTYAELDRRADVVAHELHVRGVERGEVVALLIDRSVDAIVGLWGILKAGAAYLPMDPQCPDRRIAHMLDEAKVLVCLTSRCHRPRINVVPGRDVVVVEDLPASGAPPAPRRHTRPDDLVYVIYTSGSTGDPKGVQIEHRNLVNYVNWARTRFAVDRSSRFVLVNSLAFDAACSSIFLPLVAGGSVVVAPQEHDHVSLADVFERRGANAALITPTQLDLIGRLGIIPSGFRTLLLGGEQLSGTVAAQAHQMFGPQCRIVNVYGPTEATIICVAHDVDIASDTKVSTVPIGVPGDNTRAFLLDTDRYPVDPGQVGEIYLAGAQLARGYLGRPDLDRERFVRLPDGTRAYRTGDLARHHHDGVLTYIGRMDDQIKIRGHRVEPGEVEGLLERHPRVRRALVLSRRHPDRLCAFVIPSAGVSPNELGCYLDERLPPYLVPDTLNVVSEFPSTVTGKIDIDALPGPAARWHGEDDVVDAVADIWSSLLALSPDQIAPDADFQRLGGDSLALVEMIATVAREVVGPAGEAVFMCDLRTVARNPTLEQVCQAVRRTRAS